MTNSSSRQRDRAVRQYMKDHPGTPLAEARRAIAQRETEAAPLPHRLAGLVEPVSGESLASWVDRVAAQYGIGQHEAMEALGLEPGTSATQRLRDLAAGMPDRTLARLAAAGLSAERARALTEPHDPALMHLVAKLSSSGTLGGMFEAGGPEKTRVPKTTTTVDLTASLARYGNRTLIVDLDAPKESSQPFGYDTVLIDTPGFGTAIPVPQSVWEEALVELGPNESPEEHRG
jgi:hypothetical protein